MDIESNIGIIRVSLGIIRGGPYERIRGGYQREHWRKIFIEHWRKIPIKVSKVDLDSASNVENNCLIERSSFLTEICLGIIVYKESTDVVGVEI